MGRLTCNITMYPDIVYHEVVKILICPVFIPIDVLSRKKILAIHR